MISIAFEGLTNFDKNNLIKKIHKYYSKKYKASIKSGIDTTVSVYDFVNQMIKKKLMIKLNNEFIDSINVILNKEKSNLHLNKKIGFEHNDVNLFIENISINSVKFEKNMVKRISLENKKIDLMVFFKTNINKLIKKIEKEENRKLSLKEIKFLKIVNKNLINFVRYNNSEYILLIIDDKDTIETSYDKIVKKIDEIIIDKQKPEDNKWYELYKIDVEEFATPDDYFKYKLGYKKIYKKSN